MRQKANKANAKWSASSLSHEPKVSRRGRNPWVWTFFEWIFYQGLLSTWCVGAYFKSWRYKVSDTITHVTLLHMHVTLHSINGIVDLHILFLNSCRKVDMLPMTRCCHYCKILPLLCVTCSEESTHETFVFICHPHILFCLVKASHWSWRRMDACKQAHLLSITFLSTLSLIWCGPQYPSI